MDWRRCDDTTYGTSLTHVTILRTGHHQHFSTIGNTDDTYFDNTDLRPAVHRTSRRYFDTYDSLPLDHRRNVERLCTTSGSAASTPPRASAGNQKVIPSLPLQSIDLDRHIYIRPGTCASTQAKYTIYHNDRKHDTYTRAITSRTRARYQYRIW